MSTTHNTHPHAAMVAGLRALADFLEQTPDVPRLTGDLRVHVTGRDPFIAAVRTLGDEGGVIATSGYITATRDFGGGVNVVIQTSSHDFLGDSQDVSKRAIRALSDALADTLSEAA